jgi:chromosome segregation ATPase
MYSSLLTANQLEERNEEVKALKKYTDEIQLELNKAKETLAEMTISQEQLKSDIQKLELENSNKESSIQLLEQTIRELESKGDKAFDQFESYVSNSIQSQFRAH